MFCEVRYLSTTPTCNRNVDSVIITRTIVGVTDGSFGDEKRVKWQNSCHECSAVAAIIPQMQVVRDNPNPPWNGNPYLELAG